MAGDPASPSNERLDIVQAPGFPPPEPLETIWFENAGRDVRMVFTPAPADPRGAVLLCTGYNECLEKYFETARDLKNRGFAVGLMDWPGQGLSQSLHSDRSLGYVRTFDVCVAAQHKAMDQLKSRAAGPYLVMAHSMGGAITLESLRQNAISPALAFLCAPMLGLRLKFPARAALRVGRAFGLSKTALGSESKNETFETNIFTHDERRWTMNQELVAQRPFYRLRSPTFAWANAALDLYARWAKEGAFRGVSAPVKIASAGDEMLVNNHAQQKVAERIGAMASFVSIPGARHEILMESDEIRNRLWKEFDDFCLQHSV